MNVCILTEGGKSIGFGHITRCLSLYQAFEEKGIEPKFFINGDDSVVDIVKQTDYEIINWIKSEQEILDKIEGTDIVIVDSYLAGIDFYEQVSKLAKVPVYIDDNKRLDYPKGVVVNGNIHAKDLNYPKKDGVFYLLGTKYTPLRKAFWNIPNKEIRETVQSAMITFGGNDMRNLTPRVLTLLCGNYPYLRKNVIIGRGFKNINEIEKMADKNTNLTYYPDAEKMKQVMLDSDIAISAGGQTLYELARVGVPMIVISVANNQLGNISGWQKTGFIEYAGWWEDKKVFDNILYCMEELIEFVVRKKISNIGRTLVDGKGVKRLVKSWRRI